MLAENNANIYKLGANAIKRNLYVDDLPLGTDTLDEAIKIRDEIAIILKQSCFELRKWCSNESLLDGMPRETELSVITIDKGENLKTLGLQWNFVKDTLNYSTPAQLSSRRTTKRLILAEISKLFDPLGLLGPMTLIGKLLIQKLWKLNLNWDKSVPQEIETTWEQYKDKLNFLNQLTVPRNVFNSNSKLIEFHGFCDASINAYGACIYVKEINNEARVNLLCGKSRVAPVITLSLPRLELCGATLLATLIDKVLGALRISTKILTTGVIQISFCHG